MNNKTILELRNEIRSLEKFRDATTTRAIKKVSEMNRKIFKLENRVAKMQIAGAVKPPST